jgi:hypothetical protein
MESGPLPEVEEELPTHMPESPSSEIPVMEEQPQMENAL